MSLSKYTRLVRKALDSLPIPEIVELGNRERLFDRMMVCLKKVMLTGGVIYFPDNFYHLNPSLMNANFNAVADSHGIIWAYWKTVQIPELMDMSLKDYFRREDDFEFIANDWKELGRVVLEVIYSADWLDYCFQEPVNCSICLRPMWRFITTSCEHSFHHECFKDWVKKEKNSNCPLCREQF